MLVFFLVFALFAISNTVSIDHFDKHVLSRPFTASRASDYLQTFLLFTKVRALWVFLGKLLISN